MDAVCVPEYPIPPREFNAVSVLVSDKQSERARKSEVNNTGTLEEADHDHLPTGTNQINMFDQEECGNQ